MTGVGPGDPGRPSGGHTGDGYVVPAHGYPAQGVDGTSVAPGTGHGAPADSAPAPSNGPTVPVVGPVTVDRASDAASRRTPMRAAWQSVSSKVLSERALRASEAAAAAAAASQEAAAALAAYPGAGAPTGEPADAAPATALPGRRRSQHSPFHWGFFGGIGVLLAYVSFLVLDTIRDTLLLLAIATLLAIGLNPLVSWIERRGVRRGFAVLFVFLGLLAVIGAAIYAIIPPIVTEVGSFVESIPTLIANLQQNESLRNLDERFGVLQAIQNSNIVQTIGSGAAGGLLSVGVTVATIIVDLLIILILTLYFLAGFPRIKAGAYRLVPATRRTRVTDLGDRILKQMGGYLSGATVIAMQAGLVAGVFAAIVGLPYPWAIALGAAILDFIPVVGPILVGVSMTLIGLTQSLAIGIIAGIFYLCQHLFEAYWLYPRVMKRTVDISTGAVVVAILVGAALLGVTGAILAVPVAAAIILIVREVIMPMQERS
ncbi:AI-2E family transporter [Nakamurella flava]|uniref:AI-2E family transporter n=1 Tax=Nakamurella flava TaxID=2576308 RepID=A0A4U6QA77_9ACTN|nr:AI-2E family transporter [Nakamurella flava]TKV56833.1 AI-2E family transporter [Nakamurella flava]